MKDSESTSAAQVMSPLRLVLRLAALIFMAEGLIMIFGALILEEGPVDWRSAFGLALIDGFLLILISGVAIFHWIVKPYVMARDRAEHALRESEERFRQVAENISEVFWMTDPAKQEILYVSPAYEKVWGRSCQSVYDNPLSFVEPIHPDDRDRVVAAFERQTDGSYDEAYRVVHPDGSIRHIRDRAFPVRNAAGEVYRVVGIAEDVTAQKQSEVALRDSEERFRSIIENSPDSIVLKDLEGRFQIANRNFLDRYELTEAQVLGKTSYEIRPKDLADIHTAQERKVMESATVVRDSPTVSFADGRERVLAVTRFPVFDNRGLISGVGSISADVTEQRKAERELRNNRDQLRMVTDNLPILIIYMDAEQRYRFVNKTCAEWYAQSPEDIVGKHIKEVHGPEYAKFRPHVEAVLAGEAKTFDRVVTYPDGVTRTTRLTYVPHLGPDSEVQGFFSFVEDITEYRRVEEQLRQAQKMEAVGQLTAGVAHDFNNMLAIILGNAELLEDELGKDNPQLATVFRATERGAELTQRLLAFSRKQVLHPKVINANSLIADITGLLRRTLEEHIDIETVTSADLWNCEVDPAQLENALVNLALNARDAMQNGGKLTIETANARLDDDYAAAQVDVKPGQYVMLAVTDNGSGIPPEVREHVFEPFFTTKAVGAGSGLGLSMVYGFVKQSGGHVTIYSEEGEGTTIKLYLPRSTETEAVERKPATDEVPVARGETVLVVEDDPEVRTLAAALLSGLGYQIMEAATGAAALEQLGSTTRVDLLLTDVMLAGGMNGRELAAEAEQCAPGIPVLYMSGYAEDAIIHHGRLDADAELLQKPFRRADLAGAVRRALDGPSA